MSEELSNFDAIADVYEELVRWAPYDKWVHDLERRLARYGLTRGQAILDVACGTGLSTIPWAEREYSVVGVDRSEKMLSLARGKLRGRSMDLQFVKGDLLELNLPRIFDLAICMHSGLDYILDLADLERAFRSLRRHLRPGGLLAFDKCLDEPAFYRESYTDTRKISCGTAIFHYSWDMERKLFDQLCTVLRTRPDGGVTRTAVLHRMKAVPLPELLRMTEAAGFSVIEPPKQFTVPDPGMGILRAV